MTSDLIVVGGGPAGMMAGLLFARAGCSVVVLEKHADFFRDFRGDTVHPSTMEILDQLGLLGAFLRRPHNRLDHARLTIAGTEWTIADLSHLSTPAPFVAMMPQWEFLDFLRVEARRYPGFRLQMESEVSAYRERDGRIVGVELKDGRALDARLIIAADGRDSRVRSNGLLPVTTLGSPMDVLWFRIGKTRDEGEALRGRVERGRLLVLIDRGDYWQCALVIAKGSASTLLAGGLAAFRAQLASIAPDLDLAQLGELDDLHLLSVSLDRLSRWHRPGLLAIGDAAHAMSPIGGVGINLAIQDSVAAANILAAPLADGRDVDALLARVQARRERPTRWIQRGQKLAQDRVIGRILQPGPPIRRAPAIIRLLDRFALLQRIPGRIIGLGFRRERVTAPLAPIAQPPPGP